LGCLGGVTRLISASSSSVSSRGPSPRAARLGEAACAAARGDSWLYATPIAEDLPGGLERLGVRRRRNRWRSGRRRFSVARMLDSQAQALFRPYLLTGERILWSGRPRQGIAFRSADLLLIPFSLLWAGFATFWNVEVWATGAPISFSLWGLPFLALGLYIVVGRFLHDAALRRRQYYAVTDRRVLFLRAGAWSRFRSLEIGYLPGLDLEERGDGRGTISFEAARTWPFLWGHHGWGLWVPALGSARFYAIEEPRRVYEIIRRGGEDRSVRLYREQPFP
jgi:hypothetical protein